MPDTEDNKSGQPPPQASAAWSIIEVVEGMRAPHSLMPAPLLNQIFSATILLGLGTVIFTMVRSFQAASPNPIADNLVSVISAYIILFVSGVVALRKETKVLVYDDWAKFSALTFGLLLATAFMYALAYGLFYTRFGLTPVDYFRDSNEYLIRFSVAALCSIIVTGLLSARTRCIHHAMWSQVTYKKFWIPFYTLLVAVVVTLIASY